MFHPHLVHPSGPFKGLTNTDLLGQFAFTRPDLTAAVTSCVLPPFAHYPSMRTCPPSLGQLDRFPLPIIRDIFLDVDLTTLIWSCRGLSSRAEAIVDTLLPFRRLCAYAGEALAALLATDAARFFSTREMYALLVDAPRCWTCHDFGGFLFMPQGVRCCMFCLLTRSEFMPMTKHGVMRGYWLSEGQIWHGGLPVVRPLNGLYGLEMPVPVVKMNHVPMLVSRVRARQVAAGSLTAGLLAHADLTINEKLKKKSNEDDPRTMRGWRHLWRLQCATPFPFLQIVTWPALPNVLVKVQRGVSCRGCKALSESLRARHVGDWTWGVQLDLKMFTEEEFLLHVQYCSAVQQLCLEP